MLDHLGLLVSRVIPNDALIGLASGALSLHGGVVRDTAGRIVAHLALPAVASMTSLVPGLNLVGNIITSYQLASLSEDVQQVLSLAMASTALSGLGLVVSIGGFSYLAYKLTQVDRKLEGIAKTTKDIKQILQLTQRAQLLAAVDGMRLASQAPDAETRRHLLLQSKRTFAELGYHYQSQMAERSVLAELDAVDEYCTLAFLGNAMCTSDLGMHGAAMDELSRSHASWVAVARTQCNALLELHEPARLLDARYVDGLPAQELTRLLDFTHATDRGIGWVDEMRRSLGKSTLFTSSVRVADKSSIEFCKKLRAKDQVLQSYVGHFGFLADKQISASYFAGAIEQARGNQAPSTLWITTATA